VLYGLFFIIFGAAITAAAPSSTEATAGGVSTVVIGLGIMIGLPLIYGLLGFVSGAIAALVYNILAGIVGGIRFELEGVQQEYAPPPPQQHWAPHQYPAQ
jgi:hypothetical protein